MRKATTKLAPISHQQFASQSSEELAVLRAIVVREGCLDYTLELTTGFVPPTPPADLLQALLQLRLASIEVVEAIALWLRILVRPMPFLWRGTNYLLRMVHDTDFVAKSSQVAAALGVALRRRNPFCTAPGLDMKHRVRDVSTASDLVHVIDPSETNVALRLHRAELLVLLESDGHMVDNRATDERWCQLAKQEAEEVSRRRFGGLQHEVP
ncbi:hypothetical protein SPRG_03952 [Saprolegnia parasitica CBS 223.65]|uniref:Uncharacterized protein n=1 Tax=Saprolegnia parasitica (strain CBS 223.65) TaxID=695850 RepID=A0A067CQ16_SAPPC|nr:hypothetical protein SPRG_03952 [Saprolegnia parasitica CBS 223.65]KDO31335.1 hypothetical protein SPRG_03952 [Saprolegnia parasitica CBS 223.65]|eukprot:XP_012197934.1 hypothetical protein SPRG_03952 [Saprolegnia parasitica CBS 223.65]